MSLFQTLPQQGQGKAFRKISYGLFLVAVVAVPLPAQMPGYPAPRNPDYKKSMQATVEDLLPIARTLARKPSRRQPLEPGYEIKPGERALIVVSTRFHPRVLEAIRRAIVELGAKADVVQVHGDPPQTVTGNRGQDEIRMMGGGGQTSRDPGQPPPPSFFSGFLGPAGVRAIHQPNVDSGGPGYNLVVNGIGGPLPQTAYRWEYIPWDTPDKFVYGMAGYPFEIQNLIDEKLWNVMTNARTIRATDPEGTDMAWNWRPEFAGMIREHWPGYEMILAGHMSPIPLFMSPASANANGVIGGTTNHVGSFPHMKLTIRNNEIVQIEGGGEYGKLWQEILGDCREKGIQYPGFPAPGCGWFEEAAIGSDPWRARDIAADLRGFGYGWERGRSGVIHWGLGVSQNTDFHPALKDWYDQNSGKTLRGGGHNHVHTLFTTMDFTDANGKTTRVLDKGRLTLLDDPEVRNVAAKYGNPNEFLQEKWIPPLPGVNLPGDYMKDFTSDPYSYNHAYMEKLRREAGWTPEYGN